ncbi:hypothetical protein AJ80_02441 [Polytolypa hystricis UAMH7299]|uniref:Uncharacterized protein n=1 Tax=Polytolypa hystricis (strain UAMH7299) TaxID=1447883 RepID=A0A2B7YS95_POLH7|nr:hypothetical protein AJ80_02441 [Polytolypa hystricis UAMH7299]
MEGKRSSFVSQASQGRPKAKQRAWTALPLFARRASDCGSFDGTAPHTTHQAECPASSYLSFDDMQAVSDGYLGQIFTPSMFPLDMGMSDEEFPGHVTTMRASTGAKQSETRDSTESKLPLAADSLDQFFDFSGILSEFQAPPCIPLREPHCPVNDSQPEITPLQPHLQLDTNVAMFDNHPTSPGSHSINMNHSGPPSPDANLRDPPG